MTDYKALSPIQAIRSRPGMYIGETINPNQLATEALDNALDEVANGFANKCDIYFDLKDNHCWISDNGRGIKSYQMQDANGKYENSIYLLCTATHSGSKFDNDDYGTLIGMHGVGLVVINALSNWLVVKTRDRKNKKLVHEYNFLNGELYSNESYEDIENVKKWSTLIGFEPNTDHFDNGSFEVKEFANRIMLAQAKFPNSEFSFNEKSITKRSFEEYVRSVLVVNKENQMKYIYYNKEENQKIEIYYSFEENQDTNIIGDVNLRHCDGTYLTNIQTIFKNIIMNKLGKKFENINPTLTLMGLNLYASVTVPEPKFDSQSKTRMTLDIKNDLIYPIQDKIKSTLDSNVLNVIRRNLEYRLNKKFVQTVTKNTKRISAKNKLRDCAQTPGKILYIVEGDSALGPLKQIRNIKTEAIFPLRGKMINVETATMDKIKNNKEISDLLEALGSKEKRRYENIKVLADADSDGHHIAVLALLTLLKFAGDTIKNRQVSVILPPLYGASRGKKFYPIYNHDELKNYVGYDITRFKGLGEMSPKKLKASIDAGVEYVVEYPESKKQLDSLLNIITNTEMKRLLLKRAEFNFEKLLEKARN